MRKFKTIALIGASALAMSTASTLTVQAQPWSHPAVDSRLNTSYVDSLDWRITNAARNGAISWGQARDLRSQLRAVQPIAYRNETGRARPWEVRRLQMTVNRIEAATSRFASNDRGRWRR